MKKTYCTICEGSYEKLVKAIWFHGKDDQLCDKCYKDMVKWYAEFEKLSQKRKELKA